LRSSGLAPQPVLPPHAFVQGDGLQLIFDPRPHLHQSMPVPQQLPQIAILRAGHPQPGKTIFE
jgi:hypothetical protein